MVCNRCRNELPDDSRFCQFCGQALPLSPPVIKTPPPYAAEPAFKTVFCRRCGKPIDDKTKRCLGCGKQYFRGVPPLVFLYIVLTLALLGLMAVCIVQEIHYHARINELEQLMEIYKARTI